MTEEAKHDTYTPEGFKRAMKALDDMTPLDLSRILHVNERTVKRWISGATEPHPAAAHMMQRFLDGYRPPTWPIIWDGDDLRSEREARGMSIDELAGALGMEPDTIELYESGDGPPAFVALMISWIAPKGQDQEGAA